MAFVPLVCASGIKSVQSTTGPLRPREIPGVCMYGGWERSSRSVPALLHEVEWAPR